MALTALRGDRSPRSSSSGPGAGASGVDVAHGPTITGPVPEPSVEPGVLYTLARRHHPDPRPEPHRRGPHDPVRRHRRGRARPQRPDHRGHHPVVRDLPPRHRARHPAVRRRSATTPCGPGRGLDRRRHPRRRVAHSRRSGLARDQRPDRRPRPHHHRGAPLPAHLRARERGLRPALDVPRRPAPIGDVLVATLDGGTTHGYRAHAVGGRAGRPRRLQRLAPAGVRHHLRGARPRRGDRRAAVARAASSTAAVRRHDARSRRRHLRGRRARCRPTTTSPCRSTGPRAPSARPWSTGPSGARWPVRLIALGLSLLGVVIVAVAALGRRRLLWSRTRQGVVATFGGAADATPSELVPTLAPRRRPHRVRAADEPAPGRAAAPREGRRRRPRPSHRVHRHRPRRLGRARAGGAPRTTTTGSPATARAAPAGSCAATRTGCSSPCSPEGVAEVRFGDRTDAMSEARDRILEQLDDDMKDGNLPGPAPGHRLGAGCGAKVVGAVMLFVVHGRLRRPRRAVPADAAVAGGHAPRRGWRGRGDRALRASRKVRKAGRDLTTTGLGAAYRAEGFRRFFDASEEMHAKAAADAGLLRQYLGYAVAFDAVDRWVRRLRRPRPHLDGRHRRGPGQWLGLRLHHAPGQHASGAREQGSAPSFGGLQRRRRWRRLRWRLAAAEAAAAGDPPSVAHPVRHDLTT